jgi:hypothetical protein
MEVLQISFQVLSVGFLRDIIDTDRRLGADPPVGSPKRIYVQMMRQRQQPSRVPPRCLRYPYESR